MGGEGRKEDAEAGHDPVRDEVGREGREDDDPAPAAIGRSRQGDEEGLAGTRREMAGLLLLLLLDILLFMDNRRLFVGCYFRQMHMTLRGLTLWS